MDTFLHAAIKIQSVWKMWKCKQQYVEWLERGYISETESEIFGRQMDACDEEAEYRYHMYHCGGY